MKMLHIRTLQLTSFALPILWHLSVLFVAYSWCEKLPGVAPVWPLTCCLFLCVQQVRWVL